jgi:4-amino-4-deoxy-L-arabinose transferase-like glycosyltransferase
VSEGTGAARGAGLLRGAPALLAAIVAVGALLRGVGLTGSLWVDEVDTLLHSVRLPLARLVTSYASDNDHPLYSLVAHLAVAAFGEHEWSLRLPALLFGLASLVAVERLGTRLVDRAHGLLAALLLAVSSHHVWFSQDARGYTGLLLFTLLATRELLDLLEQPRRASMARYATFAALAIYTHLSALAVVAGHLLVALAPRRRAPAVPALYAIAVALVAGFALYVPMADELLAAFTSRAQERSAALVRIAEWTRPRWALEQVITSFGGGAAGAVALSLIAVFGAVGVVSLWRRSRGFVVMHVGALPFALAPLLLLRRHLYPRLLFFEAGFAAIVLAHGALVAGRRLGERFGDPRRADFAGGACALLLATGFAASLGRVYAHPKQDFTGARDFVEATAAPGDVKIAVGAARLALPDYYAPTWRAADTAAELAQLCASSRRAWVVWCLDDQLAAAHPDVAAALARDFERVKELPGSLVGGAVHVGRSK